ncbi:MAG TPA: hypothetical protein VMI54_11895 [Polyangiaceae bacterium]|nr:hypothetical protein [Polyangiaceae bacterium]
MITPKKSGGIGALSFVAPLIAALIAGCTVTTNSDDTSANHCAQDSTVPCTSPALGYSCTGAALPTDTDAALNCGSGIESGGETTYCCNTTTSVAQNTCATDPTIVSCGTEATPYTCSGSVTPETSDPSLNCGDGVPGANGTLSYCCSATVDVSTDCVVDTTLTSCGDVSTGYTCMGGLIPTDTDPSLVCGDGVPGTTSGSEAFCCIQFTSTTCSADPDVEGCSGDSYGFSCTSSATPDEEDSSLVCSDPVPGADGKTLYCCSQ